MTEMTARVRNRLQDGMINWQEKRFQREDFRQQRTGQAAYQPATGSR